MVTQTELTDWNAEDVLDKALASTTTCRQVIAKGEDQIGAPVVVIKAVGPPPGPIAYGADVAVSPVQIYVDLNIDDDHSNKADVLELLKTASPVLGAAENEEIIYWITGAPVPPPVPPRGRVVRNALLGRVPPGPPPRVTNIFVPPPAVVAAPNGLQLLNAISRAKAALVAALRSGSFGLLVHDELVAILEQPAAAGLAPFIQGVERLIGSNQIAGTSALDGTFVAGRTCGLLFRLEPSAAIDLVQTRKPTIKVQGQAAGMTNLRIAEEFAVRIVDQAAVQHIAY